MYKRQPLYSDEFLNRVDQKAIRDAGLEIVIDYAYASTSEVLPDILQKLGVNTTPLGARVDPTYISLEQEAFQEERNICLLYTSRCV